jgi:hypothetical protein
MALLKQLPLLIALSSALFTAAHAAITTVADNATQNPLAGAFFSGFAMGDYLPALENGLVVFVGGTDPNPGNYFTNSAAGGAIASAIAYGEVLPDEPSVPTPTVFSLGGFSLDGGNITFAAGGRENDAIGFKLVGGIYTKAEGSLTTIANTHVPIPNDLGSFLPIGFGPPTADAGQVVFWGRGSSNAATSGIYVTTPAGLFAVADVSKTMPGSTNKFPGGFGFFPCLDGGDVVFSAQTRPSGPVDGILKTSGGATNSLQTVADSTFTVPGSAEQFGTMDHPVMSGGQVAFWGRTAGFLKAGIYTTVGGGLRVVADQNTAIPGGTGNFIAFDDSYGLCIKSNRVVFLGYGSDSQEGIYLWEAGQLSKLVDTNTVINGRSLRHVYFGKEAFDGTGVVFLANFFGAYFQGIYTVPVNPPTDVPTQFTLNVARLTSDSVRLSWLDSIVGAQLETSTNLLAGSWSTLASGVVKTNGENVVVLPIEPSKRFYRMVRP